MNRRAFLKLFVGTVAVATIPIPKFLLPKEESITFTIPDQGPLHYEVYRNCGGVLTQEMIEEAALKSAQNMGRPDMMIMSEKAYEDVHRFFSYKVVYE